MNASKAKQLTANANAVDMAEIYRKIEATAREGREGIQIDVSSWRNEIRIDNVISALKADGYEVSREHGYDPRDQTGWDYLSVTW